MVICLSLETRFGGCFVFREDDMTLFDWLIVGGFGLTVLFLYLIHRELVGLRTDFRQFGDMIARQVPPSDRH